ncbi:MAG: hypothetical protein F4Y86_00090 [Gammaproteobacteria bacterium]|nr:hypothetical protein [Gammaproteobacteria bacterium]MYB36310.1 hypothetical protein [Gammaproteobacteria bacterium]
MAVNTEPSRDRRHVGTVTQQDRDYMRRIGAAMAEPRGRSHGMTLVQVLERVEELNRDVPPTHDHDKERELDLHGHVLVHEAMMRKKAEWGE